MPYGIFKKGDYERRGAIYYNHNGYGEPAQNTSSINQSAKNAAKSTGKFLKGAGGSVVSKTKGLFKK